MRIVKIYLSLLFSLSFPLLSTAQNKYNLNFNEFDSTEQTMPTGWFKYGGYEIIKGELESEGNFVGKVVSDEKGKFGFIMNRLPFNYEGDTIELIGRVKYKRVKDYVGLIMWIDGDKSGHHLVFESMQNRHIRGSSDWTEYSIKVAYPPNAKYIYVGGILGKGGTAWFDDFKVTIDGKDFQTLEETKRVTLEDFNSEDLNTAILKSSSQMDLSDQETWNKSLDSLIAKVGDKKIVAIGESTHGTSEFYQLREMITKRLIREKGFNLVVLESPYDDIEVLNKELDTSPIDSLMRKHLFSIYQTKEMKFFLQWYKDNRTDNAVEFKGCDDSIWAFYELLSDNVAPMKDKKLNNLLKSLESSMLTGYSDKLKKNIKSKNRIYEDFLAIENHLKSTGNLTNSLEEILFNGRTSYINYVHLKHQQPIQSRDEIMAERISFLANQPDRKIIVWAHNAHISKEVITDREIGLMGYNLNKEFQENYYSVGLLTLQGTYSYMDEKYINGDHDYTEKLKTEKLQSSEGELWENLLAEMGSSSIVDTSILKKELNTDSIIGPTKLVGYGKEIETDIYFIPLIKHFDCLIFIENTNATTPIFN